MRKTLFVLALLASMPVAGEPLVRLHTSYYYIDGPSATVMAAQLDQNGPAGSDGKRYAGRTRWDIQWKLKSEQQGTTCSMMHVAVAVGIAQTMPKWRGEDKGAPGLKALWTKFIEALQRHERVDAADGTKAGDGILRTRGVAFSQGKSTGGRTARSLGGRRKRSRIGALNPHPGTPAGPIAGSRQGSGSTDMVKSR